MAVNAMRLTRPRCRRTIAASRVFLLRHRFQVERVHARFVAAKMVKDKTIGNWADEKQVRKPVRRCSDTPIVEVSNVEDAIAARGLGSPRPAFIGPTDGEVGKKPSHQAAVNLFDGRCWTVGHLLFY
jgi:hypothetical protein